MGVVPDEEGSARVDRQPRGLAQVLLVLYTTRPFILNKCPFSLNTRPLILNARPVMLNTRPLILNTRPFILKTVIPDEERSSRVDRQPRGPAQVLLVLYTTRPFILNARPPIRPFIL